MSTGNERAACLLIFLHWVCRRLIELLVRRPGLLVFDDVGGLWGLNSWVIVTYSATSLAGSGVDFGPTIKS